jgi:hypothetical protein
MNLTHEPGTLMFADGREEMGTWKDDELFTSLRVIALPHTLYPTLVPSNLSDHLTTSKFIFEALNSDLTI